MESDIGTRVDHHGVFDAAEEVQTKPGIVIFVFSVQENAATRK